MRVRKVILAYALATTLLTSAGLASAQSTTSSDGTTSDPYYDDPYQDTCQEPTGDWWNWSYADQRQWVIDHCSEHCPPPPEGETGWTKDDWHTWYDNHCTFYHTYQDPYYTDPYYGGSEPGYYCPPPEEAGHDTRNWTQADHDRYWYECHAQHDPCYPPPESHDWNRYDWEMWYRSCDPYYPNAECPLPPEAEAWSPEQWYQWEYECWGKHDPCYPPYETHDWTRYDWEVWYQSCDGHQSHDCPVPEEARDWNDDQWYKWEYECYGQHDPCYPPPESRNWTQWDYDAWYRNCDIYRYDEPATGEPYTNPCDPPPESRYWDPAKWEAFYRDCRLKQEGEISCPPMPDGSVNWTNAERDRWAFENCDHPPCDPLPQDFWSWSDEERHKWFAEHCGPSTTDDDREGGDTGQTVNDVIDDSPLTEEQKEAAKKAANETGAEQIVVPGPGPLLLLAGLGLVGLALRRRL